MSAGRRLASVLALVAALLALGAGGAGCAALAHPTPEDAAWAAAHHPGTTLAELQAGRALYVSHCAGCHDLHRPEEFPPERWQALVAEMAAEAKLGPVEREQVVTFLRATSARLRREGAPSRAAAATPVSTSPGATAGADS